MAPCPLPKNCRGTLRHAGIRVSADTKTWAACPIRAVLREIPAISMAVCIIPNLPIMFNKNLTFFGKKLAAKRHEEKLDTDTRLRGHKFNG